MDWKLEVITVPVSDVEKSKQFYETQCGFKVDHDTQVNENYRIVQLTPPGSGCSIVVGTNNLDMQPGAIKGLQLVVKDIEQAHAQLIKTGIDVSPVQHFDKDGNLAAGHGGDWNAFIFFSDPDGNSWAVQETPSR